MKVLFATSELAPWVKTGGLGDVSSALPAALRGLGLDVRVLIPAYPGILKEFPDATEIARPHWLGGSLPTASLKLASTADGRIFLLLDYPPYYDRPGNPYLGPDGKDWSDNHLRFGLLSRVAAWLGSEASTLAWKPDLIHCNDWQTGLAPAYLHYLPGGQSKSLFTLHNMAFQGLFGYEALRQLGLPQAAWRLDGVEYHGNLSFLKAGLQLSDAISTVSLSYVREIQTSDQGMGMEALLRYRNEKLSGILNGIDTTIWAPETDHHLLKNYNSRNLGLKAENKSALQQQLGLAPRKDLPLLAVISRLTEQKGLDLLLSLGAKVLNLPAQLVVLGAGSTALEKGFLALARRFPDLCSVRVAFDETLAHRITAGADIFVMPSRFEPCGLNQMYSMRYGTPPVVRATGGLADSVIDAADEKHGTGFVFGPATAEALLQSLKRATTTWSDTKRWRRLQQNGMSRDWSWDSAAKHYAALYQKLLPELETMPKPVLTLIAALARNRVIGVDNRLPWRLPADLKHFKTLTLGHAVIMGRKTWESLPDGFRPLPGRQNIVITRNAGYRAEGATVVHSLPDAVSTARGDKAFVIGGAALYASALSQADCLQLTEIDADFEGDTFFPEIDPRQWRESSRQTHRDEAGFDYSFVSYLRR